MSILATELQEAFMFANSIVHREGEVGERFMDRARDNGNCAFQRFCSAHDNRNALVIHEGAIADFGWGTVLGSTTGPELGVRDADVQGDAMPVQPTVQLADGSRVDDIKHHGANFATLPCAKLYNKKLLNVFNGEPAPRLIRVIAFSTTIAVTRVGATLSRTASADVVLPGVPGLRAFTPLALSRWASPT